MKELNFEKTMLGNGAPLYVMHMPHAHSVAAGIFVKGGTRDEIWPKEAGLAHALEHMSFQGTKNFPTSKDLSAYLEEIGGDHNAWTSSEGTFYHNRVPVSHKDRGFRVLAEMLREPLIPQDKIRIEMKNIIEEIRRANDDPDQFLGLLDQGFVYGSHPLGKNTLGTIESVSGFTQDNFLEFRRRYYRVHNYVFLVAGNITVEEAKQAFEEFFSSDKDEQSINVYEPAPLGTVLERKLVHKKDLEQVHICLSAPLGKGLEKTTRSIGTFSTMLSGGMSFPLFQEVRDKRGLCYEIHANVSRDSDVGEFSIVIGTDPKRYQEAVDVSLSLISQCKNDGALLKKAKDLVLGNLAMRFENTGGIIQTASHSTMINGYPKGYDELVQDINEITVQDVSSAVDQYLKPENIRQVLLVPKDLEVK
jgi:predicted Zn-dependent peptidase